MMVLQKQLFGSLFVWIGLVAHVAAQVNVDTQVERYDLIRAALDTIGHCAERPGLCENNESPRAEETLMRMPKSEVLPLVLEKIQADPVFQKSSARNMLYGVLVASQGEMVAEIRQQLLAGLNEPYNGIYGIVSMCAEAISRSQDERDRRTAVERLVSRLNTLVGRLNGGTLEFNELRQLTEIIQGISYFGKDAETGLKNIEQVFRDETLTVDEMRTLYQPRVRTAPELDRQHRRMLAACFELRAAALGAILRIDGLERVLVDLKNVDPVGRRIMLHMCRLRGDGAEPKGLFDGNRDHEKAIRNFVIDSLDSQSVDVRTGAVDVLFLVFGDDGVVFDSPTSYRLNPQIESALQKMANGDPDDGLRERAGQSLVQLQDRLDDAAQKILRKRCEAKKESGKQPVP